MSAFLNKNFLLQSETAKILYHRYAEKMPIYDYHCHIDPKDIWEDVGFENISKLWLGADHYKWRIMRSNGVEEKYITGDAPDREKFQKFAEALPKCIGNPMYHWCHLELKNYFGYDDVLNGETAETVWVLANEKLKEPDFSARSLIRRSNVAMIGTTDDPCSDLKYHELIAESGFETKVLPSFRPDAALNISKRGFKNYILKLSQTVGIEINSAADVAKALSIRMDFFDKMGCRSADHGLDYVPFRNAELSEAEDVFRKTMSGQSISREESEAYQNFLLLHCGREYKRRDWAMQLHFGCMRNPNSKAYDALGADTGFDSMAASDSSTALYEFMNALEAENSLPKTILYSLNPTDNAWIDTLLGAFQSSQLPGKIQHGSAWWFNDNKQGIIDQLTSLANLGILGNFIGMLTDSRSLLSFSRHEYFRRILCNLLGAWVENGEYPDDLEVLGALVQDICAGNAKRYFNV